jgi:hypothetical protein
MLLLKKGADQVSDLEAGTPVTTAIGALAKRCAISADAALDVLRRFADDDIEAASDHVAVVADVLSEASIDKAQVKKLLDGDLGKFLLETRPGELGPRARTLAADGATLKYSLDISRGTQATKAGDITLGASASTDIVATINVLRGPVAAVAPAITIPSEDSILRFAIGGSIDVEGSFRVPFNGGGGSGSAGAGAHVDAELCFQWPASTTIVGALVESVSRAVSPWSLDEVADRLAPVDRSGACSGLRRIQINTSGHLQLTGEVSVGRTLMYSADDFRAGQDLTATLAAHAGVTLGWSTSGELRFLVERAAMGNGIQVSVHRTRTTASAIGFDLTAELSVTGLGPVLQPLVDRFFPDAGGLITKLEGWSAPGTELVKLLGKKLKTDDQALRTIADLMLGKASPDEARATLRGLILDQIRELADTRVPLWNRIEQPEAFVNQIWQSLIERLGIEGKAAAQLWGSLGPPLTECIAELKHGFDNALKQIVAGADKPLETILKPLAIVGENVQELAKAVDANAEALLAPALKLLQRYEAVRGQVLAVVEVAAKLKLGLALKSAYERRRAEQAELVLRIDHINARTSAIYRTLLTGRVDVVWNLLQQAVAEGDVFIVDGAFTSAISRQKTLDLSFNFGDIRLAWEQASASAVEIHVDANGTLTLGKSQFTHTNVVKAFGETNSVSFGGTMDIAAAMANPGATLPVTFAFGLTYDDERPKRKELERYLESLRRRSAPVLLIAESAIADALDHYDSATESACISTALLLDGPTLNAIVQLSGTSQGRSRILRTARAALFVADPRADDILSQLFVASNPRTPLGFADLLAEIEARHIHTDDALSSFIQARADINIPVLSGAAQRVLNRVNTYESLAHGLAESLEALRDAPQAFQAAVAKATLAPVPKRAGMLAEELDGTNARINRGLGRRFKELAGSGEVAHWTVALLATLAQLGDASQPLLHPIVQLRTKTGAIRLLAL